MVMTEHNAWVGIRGQLRKIINEKTLRVRILWDEECLGVSDVRTSNHKLVKGNWNPKTAKRESDEKMCLKNRDLVVFINNR